MERTNLMMVAGPVALLITAVLAAHYTTLDFSPVARMFIFIGILFFGLKGILLVLRPSPNWPAAGAFLVWPGMNPSEFRTKTGRASLAWGDIFKPALCMITGCVYLTVLAPRATGYLSQALLTGVGLLLIVHFGIFGWLHVFYRLFGWRVREIFRQPWAARGVGDFWGGRWNRGFSEFTSLLLYRPVILKWGWRVATMVSFAISGILHEFAISLPVQAGYGGPFLYFLMHGLLVIAEKDGRWNQYPRFNRLVFWVSIIVPLPVLFHEPFIRGVIFPLAGVNV
jgi:hypothetical protein